MPGMNEQASIADLEQRLVVKYAQVPRERVVGVIQSAHASFADCHIREFVPLLVERRAHAELLRPEI